jgi:3-deoxy-D-manno-octulosonate 8-phosphate phosphatase (KDO 8-P phosphatase)
VPAKRLHTARIRKPRASTSRSSSKTGGSVAALIRRIRLVAFDFDGVFTDNSVYVAQDGTEAVRCWRGDGLGLRELKRLGIATVVVSTETNAVVQHRSQKLQIRCFNGCEDKLSILSGIADEMGISLGEVAFVGNDVNDLACLTAVGLPIVVSDAHPSVARVARYRTETRGGYGAVREICDLFAGALSK